jgi:serine/threonine-protein phosphatase 2B catalytic subunit
MATKSLKESLRRNGMENIEIEECENQAVEEIDHNMDTSHRAVPHVMKPSAHKMKMEYLIDQKRAYLDYRVVKSHFLNGGRLTEDQVEKIIEDSKRMLKKEPNLLRFNEPTTIIGDVHGQFYDLNNLIERFNLEKDVLLFLGDYVDRGYFSVEVYLYLLLLKCFFPRNIFLLRGNHESATLTKYFTFREECVHKYNPTVYKECVRSFRCLPLAAIVLDKIYCVHGGISPFMNSLEDINSIDRFREPPSWGLFCDILWSDPHPLYDIYDGPEEFVANQIRRFSYYYTHTGVSNFLEQNNLLCMVRGHEVQSEGYRLYRPFRGNIPSVITIFSAPNYCDVYKNAGAALKFDGVNLKIRKFKEVSHPFCLPGFLDAVNWSFPSVGEKVSEFYLDLLKFLRDRSSTPSGQDSVGRGEEEVPVGEEIEKTQTFSNAMAIMREERECLNELEDEESTELHSSVLNFGENEEMDYNEAKVKDMGNEIFISDEMFVIGTSINTSSSCAAPITKVLSEANLDNIINHSKILTKSDDKQKVEVSGAKRGLKILRCCFGGD